MFPSCNLWQQNIGRCFLPATCGNKTSDDVSFLQPAATKHRAMFPSCNLWQQNIGQCFLPATCGNKTSDDVSFLQSVATKKSPK
jgi:hypothetical protein